MHPADHLHPDPPGQPVHGVQHRRRLAARGPADRDRDRRRVRPSRARRPGWPARRASRRAAARRPAAPAAGRPRRRGTRRPARRPGPRANATSRENRSTASRTAASSPGAARCGTCSSTTSMVTLISCDRLLQADRPGQRPRRRVEDLVGDLLRPPSRRRRWRSHSTKRPHAGLGDQHHPGPLVGRQRRGTRAAPRPSAPRSRSPARPPPARSGAAWPTAPPPPGVAHRPSLTRRGQADPAGTVRRPRGAPSGPGSRPAAGRAGPAPGPGSRPAPGCAGRAWPGSG